MYTHMIVCSECCIWVSQEHWWISVCLDVQYDSFLVSLVLCTPIHNPILTHCGVAVTSSVVWTGELLVLLWLLLFKRLLLLFYLSGSSITYWNISLIRVSLSEPITIMVHILIQRTCDSLSTWFCNIQSELWRSTCVSRQSDIVDH